jgi:hypothetical protein
MKTIYRIELENGDGMYRSRCGLNAFDVMPIGNIKHPMPHDDSLLEKQREIKGVDSDKLTSYRFGFSSKGQLRSWIYNDRWLVDLHKIGYVISEYVCSDYDVLVGHTQAIFKNEIEKESFSILDYFRV